MKYRFGSDPYNYNNIADIEANTLEFAILKFAYTNRDFSKYLDKESKKKLREMSDDYEDYISCKCEVSDEEEVNVYELYLYLEKDCWKIEEITDNPLKLLSKS